MLSNVPDIDDEDAILEGMIENFKIRLGFEDPPLTIHRYPSLSLLRQEIFAVNRPRTRLAKEYERLAFEIVRLNPLDRVGAINYIDHCEPRPVGIDDAQDEQLKRIGQHHAEDGEVLYHLGRLWARSGDLDASLARLDQAIEAGYVEPGVFLDRARQRRLLDDATGASEDALEVFRSTDATFPDWMMALRLLVTEDIEQLPAAQGVQESKPLERIRLATRMTRRKAEAAAAMTLLAPLLAAGDLDPTELDMARQGAVLACMALGRFNDAASLCLASAPSVRDMPIQHAFNYAMALWGATGEVPRDTLARVVELSAERPPGSSGNANYEQCLALAHWASGTPAAAKAALEDAEEAIRAERNAFSCWRYLTVPRPAFVEDLREIRQMIDRDDTVLPRFIRQQQAGEPASPSTDEAVVPEREERA